VVRCRSPSPLFFLLRMADAGALQCATWSSGSTSSS
jgi:hypothetical protein